MAKQPDLPRYWIFQAMPERFDLADKLEPGKSDTWILTRYRNLINPGDVVYFWRGGRQAGLYGWGLVTDSPYEQKTKGGVDWRVLINYKHRFTDPIRKDDILKSSQETQLSTMTIIRAPQGGVFKLTTKEAESLNQLIRERSETSPDDPFDLALSHVPALSLAPLNMGRPVAQLLSAGFRVAEQTTREPLDVQVLLWIILAQGYSSNRLPESVSPLIEKVSSLIEIPKEVWEVLEQPIPSLDPEMSNYIISAEILNIMESARLLAIYSTRKEEIGFRHFLGGFLLASKDSTLIRLEELTRLMDSSVHDLMDLLTNHIVSMFPRDDKSLWMSILTSGVQERLNLIEKLQMRAKADIKTNLKSEQLKSDKQADIKDTGNIDLSEPSEEPASEKSDSSSRALSVAFSGRPVPDRPFGADLLQIKSEVDAMAHLFALSENEDEHDDESERVTFALGLFGRWGSGKSFFIEKLKNRITELATSESGDKTLYCKQIVQIDFNAWHYNEANIWASLVHHIFDTLQKQFLKIKKEKEFRNLISKLEISQERREQLTQKIKSKKTIRNDLEQRIKTHEEKINSIIDDQMKQISSFPKRLAMNQKAREKLMSLLPEAAKILGLPDGEMTKTLKKGEHNTEELLNLLKESKAIVGESRSIGKTIWHSGFTKSFMLIAGIVLLVYFALPAVLKNPNLWNDLLSETGQIIALATPVLIWLRTRLMKASDIFNQISSVESMLQEDLREEEEQKNTALATLRTEQKRVSESIENDTREKALLDQEILNLKNKLDDLGSAESLVDYINDRATSEDYRSKLGILALIRRDFEKLSKLMLDRPKANDIETDDRQSENELPHIDRIILYIDDLDRVQDSKKVLQVLEAVHLLLAFPLFHVVVAVDERWAAQSVLSHHKDFFEVGIRSDDADDDKLAKENHYKSWKMLHDTIGMQKATPREFLEKIFQISFWVRPLTIQLTQDFIEGIVVQDNVEYVYGPEEFEFNLSSQKNEAIAESNHNEGRTNQPEEEDSEKSIHETPDNEDVIQETIVPEPPMSSAEIQTDQPNDNDEADAFDPTGFEITSEELVSMRALARVIDRSPRTVKRFVRIYKLFKAMNISKEIGFLNEDELEEYNIEEDHVPIMILLAIQIGHPDIAVRFFRILDSALTTNDTQTMGQLLNEMKEQTIDNKAEKQKWQRALTALESITDLYGPFPRVSQIIISAFNPWLASTARFGFQEWTPDENHLI